MVFRVPFQRKLSDGSFSDVVTINCTLPDSTATPQSSSSYREASALIEWLDALFSGLEWSTSVYYTLPEIDNYPQFAEYLHQLMPSTTTGDYVFTRDSSEFEELYINGERTYHYVRMPSAEDLSGTGNPVNLLSRNGGYSTADYDFPPIGASATRGIYQGTNVYRTVLEIPVWPNSYIQQGNIVLPTITFNESNLGNLPIFKLEIQIEGHNNTLRKVSAKLNSGTVMIAKALYDILQGLKVSTLFEDPYSPGGISGGGGGGGSFDGSSTPIAHPGLPTIQASDTGFVTLYSPSISQVKAMADYMWSDGFSLDDFKKLFSDPMQSILSFHAVPVAVPKGGIRSVKIGNIDTGVYMPPVTNQWVEVNCGTLTLPEYWGAYLDYDPYTQLQLYLPYIGTSNISADDVMGKALSLHYNFDVLSGACIATLMSGGTVLYNFQGSGSMQIPFTSLTYGNLLSSIIQIAGAGLAVAGTVVAGAATGGIGLAPATAAAGGAIAASSSALVNAQKRSVSHGGAMGGSGGFMGIQVPYFILTRPSLCLPEFQNDFIGYPSFTTVKLSSLSGFTRVREIHFEYMGATTAELEELERILKEGVLF